MDEAREFHAGPDDSGRRFDRVLRRFLPELPLSAIYGALRKGWIRLNGRKAKPDARLEEGDILGIQASLLEGSGLSLAAEGNRRHLSQNEETGSPEAELLSLDPYLVFAGRELLFLNKPRGMPSHGPGGLDSIVAKALASRSAASLSFVPGPLHRLDRNSSGLIAFPRSAAGARAFTALLRAGRIRKRYLALLKGLLETAEDWKDLLRRDREREITEVVGPGAADALNAAPAISHARPLLRAGNLSLALVEIETGLTHQIRAQAGHRELPLAGDLKYGGGSLKGGYFLHAWLLDLLEKPFPDLPSRLEAPLPPSSETFLASLFGTRELEAALDSVREGRS